MKLDISSFYFGWHPKTKRKITHIKFYMFAIHFLLQGVAVDNTTCQLPQCWAAGRQLLLHGDLQADPCDNFARFACGRWIDSHSETANGDLDNVSAMDEKKEIIDKTVRGEDRNSAITLK